MLKRLIRKSITNFELNVRLLKVNKIKVIRVFDMINIAKLKTSHFIIINYLFCVVFCLTL